MKWRPAMQPQLLRPHDVRECAVNPAVAAPQVAEILLPGQLGGRVEDRAVRPGVVVEQLEELVHAWQQVGQQASDAAFTSGAESPTFTTKTSQRYPFGSVTQTLSCNA